MEKIFKKDDIITTYYKGVFKVTKVVKRFKTHDPMYVLYEGQEESFNCKFLLDEIGNKIEINPLIYFVKIADTNFKLVKSTKEQFCDSVYCQTFDNIYENLIFDLEQKIETLKNFKNSIK